jgi:hypothetical protein
MFQYNKGAATLAAPCFWRILLKGLWEAQCAGLSPFAFHDAVANHSGQ